MTPEEHNKYLGIAHLAYGGLYALFMLVMAIFFFFFISVIGQEPSAPPFFFFALWGGFMLLFFAAFTIPAFIAGYGLLKRKPWARIWAIIASILAASNFPIGTAVCVYSVWFLLGDAGKEFYEKIKTEAAFQPPSRAVLNEPGPGEWRATVAHATREREATFAPAPPKMPDWRGDE